MKALRNLAWMCVFGYLRYFKAQFTPDKKQTHPLHRNLQAKNKNVRQYAIVERKKKWDNHNDNCRLLQWVIINNDSFETKTAVSSQKEEKGVCYSAVAHRRILDEWEEGWFWFLNANVVFGWKEGMEAEGGRTQAERRSL